MMVGRLWKDRSTFSDFVDGKLVGLLLDVFDGGEVQVPRDTAVLLVQELHRLPGDVHHAWYHYTHTHTHARRRTQTHRHTHTDTHTRTQRQRAQEKMKGESSPSHPTRGNLIRAYNFICAITLSSWMDMMYTKASINQPWHFPPAFLSFVGIDVFISLNPFHDSLISGFTFLLPWLNSNEGNLFKMQFATVSLIRPALARHKRLRVEIWAVPIREWNWKTFRPSEKQENFTLPRTDLRSADFFGLPVFQLN